MREIASDRKHIAIWLMVVCAVIFAMVVVGGVTRLTHSGLSIVEWEPIVGVIPPLTEAEWMDKFEEYKKYPEYQKVNKHLDLEGFKFIFYWEYGHRLLGRMIGIIFFLPFLYFLLTGKVEKPFVGKLWVAFILGGLQGLMGWYMVKSGLVDLPRVSHYRLAAHLLLALLIMAWIFMIIRDLLETNEGPVEGLPQWWSAVSWILLVLIVFQITWGAFTAGLRAGFGYNTFPLMNDQWIADAVFLFDPWWLNFFEGNAGVQFLHRWLGTLLLIFVSGFWLHSLRSNWDKRIKIAANWLLVAIGLQFFTGVITLIYVVPLFFAAAHQAVACVLLLASVNLVWFGLKKSAV